MNTNQTNQLKGWGMLAGGLAGGLMIGAGLMYLLDPDLGLMRRSRIRNVAKDQVDRTRHQIGETTRDFKNRVRTVLSGMGHHDGDHRMRDRDQRPAALATPRTELPGAF